MKSFGGKNMYDGISKWASVEYRPTSSIKKCTNILEKEFRIIKFYTP